MTGVPVSELLQRIAALAGVQVDAEATPSHKPLPLSSPARPAWAAEANLTPERDVDLLPMDQTLDADPLPLVIRVIHALQPGQVMRFRHKWEPQPFYDLWTRMGGLKWFSEQRGADEWWVWVRCTAWLSLQQRAQRFRSQGIGSTKNQRPSPSSPRAPAAGSTVRLSPRPRRVLD